MKKKNNKMKEINHSLLFLFPRFVLTSFFLESDGREGRDGRMIQPLALSSIGFDDLSDSDSDESASHQHALASIGFDEDEDSSPVVSPLPPPAQVAAAVPAAARASEDKGLETLQLSAARPHSSAGPPGSLIDTQATVLSQFDDSSLAV